MSWPETAQATVLLAGAAVLLNTQAERGQIPSVTGPQPTVITTCASGCWGGNSLLHRQVSRREGRAAALKKTGSRTNEGRQGQ